LYEDDCLLVLDKPAGLPVHGDAKAPSRATVLARVRDYLKQTEPAHLASPDFSPAFMHRLDKETSGVLVLAKTREALRSLNRQLKFKKIDKIYVALVWGTLRAHGSIRRALRKKFDRRSWKEVMIADRRGGIFARTDYRVIENLTCPEEKFSLVEAQPITGRTHQLRAHFAAIGHPIVGDALYGDERLNRAFAQELGFTRHFLHCARLKLTHPGTQTPIEFIAPLAPELILLLERLRLLANVTEKTAKDRIGDKTGSHLKCPRPRG
jgi:23S rRNA pseudouridine955/2504/2580 synthase